MQKRAQKTSAAGPLRPTAKEISNYVTLSKCFKKAQYSKSSHPGLLEKLTGIYNSVSSKT